MRLGPGGCCRGMDGPFGIVVEPGELWALPNVVGALTLDRQGLSTAVRPPPSVLGGEHPDLGG
jgi:hypothetical protein